MSDGKQGAGILGIGVAACVACCAAPILGFITAIGIGTVLAVGLFGVAGVLVGALAIIPVVRRRRAGAGRDESVDVVIAKKP
jgi:hypothetical protein